jgi:hypothetical protein
MPKPKPDQVLCAHAGCKRVVPPGGLWCEAHLRQANTNAARVRLLGWRHTGRRES